MADRHSTELARRIDPLDNTNLNRSTNSKFRLVSEDVIAALTDATENRRAQQVGEWERLRQQSFRRSSLNSPSTGRTN
ncbi:MAG: hypothetical protein KBD94_05710 [Pyrinomonadaceae bacterium]|nr:hypothetical protein [Pyrinomonadaceae bacterium]